MIKEYIKYLKDNPQGYWFKAKLCGWGWTPAKWQGWLVIFLYILLILGLVFTREKAIPGNPDSGSNFLTFALPIIVLGCLLNFGTIAIDLSGTTVAHFWFGLFTLGVGWNFMYIGGTTLLTETYRPSERTRVQGFNDTVVFTTMAISSSSAGVLVNAEGWEIVNYTAAPFIAIALVAAVALALRSRRAAAAL